MSDKDLGYIKGTLDALVASHAELKITLNTMVTNLKKSQEDMEDRVDKLEQRITWIYAWAAAAAAVVSTIAYFVFNIWSNLR